METTTKKQRIFENLLNMTCEPLVVGKPKVKQFQSKKEGVYFSTIFSALNNVSSSQSVIKVNPGLYNQSIIIKKNHIKIQAAEISENSILMNEEFINILIDLENPQDKTILQFLKIANASENSDKHQIINQSFENLKEQNYKGFKIGQSINCCIYVKRGILQVEECKISMATYNNDQILMPCIIVDEQGTLILNRSEVKGGQGTIGIVNKNGKVIVKESIIRDHGGIGIFCTGNEKTSCLIKNSSITHCKEGITLNGPFTGVIESNILNQCSVASISIAQGNKTNIIDNQIFRCTIGVSIKNGQPTIAKNNITESKEWGIECRAMNSYICKANIKFNLINQNGKGAILVDGTLNSTDLCGNTCKFNNVYGIKVQRRANPHIFMNKIIKTLGDGVYVCEGSTVFLQKNQINGSLKSNVVLEGPNNIDNFIFNNVIQNARGEGIFIMYAQKFFIKCNKICNNHNGIVSLTGVLNIETNQIYENEANGILLLQDNDVTVVGNKIEKNGKAGIFVRNTSVGKIENNYFSDNKFEMVVENDDQSFENVEEANHFMGTYDIRLPKNYRCQLI